MGLFKSVCNVVCHVAPVLTVLTAPTGLGVILAAAQVSLRVVAPKLAPYAAIFINFYGASLASGTQLDLRDSLLKAGIGSSVRVVDPKAGAIFSLVTGDTKDGTVSTVWETIHDATGKISCVAVIVNKNQLAATLGEISNAAGTVHSIEILPDSYFVKAMNESNGMTQRGMSQPPFNDMETNNALFRLMTREKPQQITMDSTLGSLRIAPTPQTSVTVKNSLSSFSEWPVCQDLARSGAVSAIVKDAFPMDGRNWGMNDTVKHFVTAGQSSLQKQALTELLSLGVSCHTKLPSEKFSLIRDVVSEPLALIDSPSQIKYKSSLGKLAASVSVDTEEVSCRVLLQDTSTQKNLASLKMSLNRNTDGKAVFQAHLAGENVDLNSNLRVSGESNNLSVCGTKWLDEKKGTGIRVDGEMFLTPEPGFVLQATTVLPGFRGQPVKNEIPLAAGFSNLPRWSSLVPLESLQSVFFENQVAVPIEAVRRLDQIRKMQQQLKGYASRHSDFGRNWTSSDAQRLSLREKGLLSVLRNLSTKQKTSLALAKVSYNVEERIKQAEMKRAFFSFRMPNEKMIPPEQVWAEEIEKVRKMVPADVARNLQSIQVIEGSTKDLAVILAMDQQTGKKTMYCGGHGTTMSIEDFRNDLIAGYAEKEAEKLNGLIEKALQQGGAKVDLVFFGHSMGGNIGSRAARIARNHRYSQVENIDGVFFNTAGVGQRLAGGIATTDNSDPSFQIKYFATVGENFATQIGFHPEVSTEFLLPALYLPEGQKVPGCMHSLDHLFNALLQDPEFVSYHEEETKKIILDEVKRLNEEYLIIKDIICTSEDIL